MTSVDSRSVLAFDVDNRTWVDAQGADARGARAIPMLSGRLVADAASLTAASRDLGRIVTARPGAVLEPGAADDIEVMVAFCAEHHIPVSARGEGHTTGGQSLTRGGLVIAMGGLNRVHHIGEDEVDVDAGVLWLDLVRTLAERGLRVACGLPDYLRLTVGGTLMVGGLGVDYRRGGQIEAVRAAEVVTPAHGRVWCSEADSPDLFHGVLAGLGQLGVLLRVRLAVEPLPAAVWSDTRDYTDPCVFFADARRLLEADQVDEVRCAVLPPTAHTSAVYRITVTTHDVHGRSARAGDVTYLEHVEATTHEVDVRRAAGWDELHKPWFAAFLPDEEIEQFVLAVVQLSHEDWTGWVQLYPHRSTAFERPLLRVPTHSRWVWVLGIFTAVDGSADDTYVARMLLRNRRLDSRTQAVGGVRYPIDTADWTVTRWAQHYGAVWAALMEAKRRYDPAAIMTRGVGMFPSRFEHLPGRSPLLAATPD